MGLGDVDRGCLTPYQAAVLDGLELIAAELDGGNETRRCILSTLERMSLQQAQDSETLERIAMISETVQQAADQLLLTTQQVQSGVNDLIAAVGGTGGQTGATDDEVLSLLSPIQSLQVDTLEAIHLALGGGEPPAATARRAVGGPASRIARRQ